MCQVSVMLGLGYRVALVKDMIMFSEENFSLKALEGPRYRRSLLAVGGLKNGVENRRLRVKLQISVRSGCHCQLFFPSGILPNTMKKGWLQKEDWGSLRWSFELKHSRVSVNDWGRVFWLSCTIKTSQ